LTGFFGLPPVNRIRGQVQALPPPEIDGGEAPMKSSQQIECAKQVNQHLKDVGELPEQRNNGFHRKILSLDYWGAGLPPLAAKDLEEAHQALEEANDGAEEVHNKIEYGKNRLHGHSPCRCVVARNRQFVQATGCFYCRLGCRVSIE